MTKKIEQREADIADFMARAGWGGAVLVPLAGDASTRSYRRARRCKERALLMIAPPSAEAPSCPPEASETERRALGYNACARLAGPNLSAFVAIAEMLRAAGLSAPEVYAADAALGYALIEDLGDDLFARVVGDVPEATLYEHAIDALAALFRAKPETPRSDAYTMLSYDRLALISEAALLVDWYWPLKKGANADEELRQAFDGAVNRMLDALAPASTPLLRDFHAENLIWMPARQGVQRVGMIDFQDGLVGSPAYDVVSLLEDARRDVTPELAEAMLVRFCEACDGVQGFARKSFLSDYAILAAQRNAKILGVFARLAKRDGKPRYLDLLPRVEAHFRKDLMRPECAPLREFVNATMPELAS